MGDTPQEIEKRLGIFKVVHRRSDNRTSPVPADETEAAADYNKHVEVHAVLMGEHFFGVCGRDNTNN